MNRKTFEQKSKNYSGISESGMVEARTKLGSEAHLEGFFLKLSRKKRRTALN